MAAMASSRAASLPSSSAFSSNFSSFTASSSSFDVRTSYSIKSKVSGKFFSQNLASKSSVSDSRVARIAGGKGYHRGRDGRFARCAVERDDRPVSDQEGKPVEIPPSWLEPSSSKPVFDDFEPSPIQKWLYPSKDELPDDVEMTIWDHLEELRERILVSVGFVGLAIVGCFIYAKDLVTILEAPVYSQGVRFLQLSPGEYFFTTLKVSGYSGLLIGSPIILYEIIAFVVPGLTMGERKFLAPIVFGSSILFYAGLFFSYKVLTPAALTFFINYAEGVVESLWSIDQYFEFVFVLMLSTGLSFQVPVIQLLLGNLGLVSGRKMLSIWRYVVVGAVIAAAVLTPSTDPLTQLLLAGPLIGLYMGGAYAVLLTESTKEQPNQ